VDVYLYCAVSIAIIGLSYSCKKRLCGGYATKFGKIGYGGIISFQLIGYHIALIEVL